MKAEKKIIMFGLLIALSSWCYEHKAIDFSDLYVMQHVIDFDESMQVAVFQQALKTTEKVFGIEGIELLSFFRDLYNKNNMIHVKPQATLKIPKIIHQVWLGGKVPDVFVGYMHSWLEKHLDGWIYKLWTDENVAALDLYNQKYFDAVDNCGIKSDIVKWEVVYRFGGVYIDTDFECLKSLDVLHYTYDFYTGIQPLDTQYLQLGAAIFGAVPGHPILEHCIKTVKDDWNQKGIPAKTGPIHFTKSFFAVAGKHSDMIDIAFPASFFYPLGCRQDHSDYDSWMKPEAFAVHWWAKSWMPTKYRPYKFRIIDNDESAKSWND